MALIGMTRMAYEDECDTWHMIHVTNKTYVFTQIAQGIVLFRFLSFWISVHQIIFPRFILIKLVLETSESFRRALRHDPEWSPDGAQEDH